MRVEFRTLDGAIAMREVAEPLPPTMIIPCWVPLGATNQLGNHTTTREYQLKGGGASPMNPFYVEMWHEPTPPAHAAEIDRIADDLRKLYKRDNGGFDGLEFDRALADLRSLKKRYFAHTEGKEELRMDRDSWKAKSEKIAVTLTNERAAHAETKRQLVLAQDRTTREIHELANMDAVRSALKEFLK